MSELSIKCDLGQYDIPIVQMQPHFCVDLVRSNIALFGASMSGKTNFLKLLINCLHKKCSCDSEQIFILDFSGALQEYRDMPLVSAYFDNSNEEYVKRVFKILENILKANTKTLGSSSFASGENKVPHTTFIIDNLNAFVDETRYSAYHEKFGRLCRDGRSRGITIVFTASDTKGISRYLLSFEQTVALGMSPEKYTEIFGEKVEAVGNVPGRGYTNVTERPDGITGTFNMNRPYEVQLLIADDIRDADCRFMQILRRKFRFDDASASFADHVRKYQTFPSELDNAHYDALKQPFDADDKIPSSLFIETGLDYVDFKPVGVDFNDSRVVGIYGKKEFGKTNLLNILVDGLISKKTDARFVFFDDGRRQLKELYAKCSASADCLMINEFGIKSVRLSSGKTIERKLSPMQQFYRLIHEEYLSLAKDYDNSVLEQIYGVDDVDVLIDDIPQGAEATGARPTVFIIQSKSVFLNSKISSDFIHYILPELLDVAEENDYIFIFSDVKKINDAEVNSVFNSTLKNVFLLDNIAEFASERGSKSVFGDMDVKSLKEDYARCELGDGYFYDVEGDSLRKSKFIKVI